MDQIEELFESEKGNFSCKLNLHLKVTRLSASLRNKVRS